MCSQLSLDFFDGWNDPESIFRAALFWSLNGDFDYRRLQHQLEEMKEQRVGGFFMHSRYGLEAEYLGTEWFNAVRASIEYAHSNKMKAYLYDEDRWPSGIAGGIVTRDNPEYQLKYLLCTTLSSYTHREGDIILGYYNISLDCSDLMHGYELVLPNKREDAGFICVIRRQEPRSSENGATYLDVFNSAAVSKFIECTHQAYYCLFSQYFGNTIPAIFTDEANYGYWFCNKTEEGYVLPSSDIAIEFFKRQWNYDIANFLPELFFTKAGSEFSRVRLHYYEVLTALFVKNFNGQIGQWCQEHGIALTGHMLYEEPFTEQIKAVGSMMRHYEHMQWPGVDSIGDQIDDLITIKQCTSVGAQLGKKRVLCEMYAGTGWDWPLEGHKFIAGWNIINGVNFICPHISHYSLAGTGKRDYPASILDHTPWWKYYRYVQDFLGRITYMVSDSRPVRDILIMHPIESAWGMFSYSQQSQIIINDIETKLKTICYNLRKWHYDFDFGDEYLISKYAKVGQTFHVGEMEYKLVVLPPSSNIRRSTMELLSKFLEYGGHVLIIGDGPKYLDGEESNELIEFKTKCTICNTDDSSVHSAIKCIISQDIEIQEGGVEQESIWHMLVQKGDGYVLLLQSLDRKDAHNVRVRVNKRLLQSISPIIEWNALTSERYVIESSENSEFIYFDISIMCSDIRIITFGIMADAEMKADCFEYTKSDSFGDSFEYSLTELNGFPITVCRFRAEGDFDWSDLMATDEVDEILRERHGLVRRHVLGVQPWYHKRNKSYKHVGVYQVLFDFEIDKLSSRYLFVLENSQHYTILINGNVVKEREGHWIDPDFHTYDVSSQVKLGLNTIVLEFQYSEDVWLENVYLLGDFGVWPKDKKLDFRPSNISLGLLPERLRVQPWNEQGLSFYTGAVNYKLTFNNSEKYKESKIRLPYVKSTAVVLHVNGDTYFLPWMPYECDISKSLICGKNDIVVELIGGRKNMLGPLRVDQSVIAASVFFFEHNKDDGYAYKLTEHGLLGPICIDCGLPASEGIEEGQKSLAPTT